MLFRSGGGRNDDACVLSRWFFFFSSRRRHTRLQGDWSSDVCSSDLTPDLPTPTPFGEGSGLLIIPGVGELEAMVAPPTVVEEAASRPEARPRAREIGRASCRERV